MIALEDVSFAYPGGVRALDGVSVQFTSGCVCVLGQNGSGKSTLMKHLNGLLRPTSGRVLVDGSPAGDRSVAQLARHVGLVFQNPDDQLFHSSVKAEVRFGAHNMGFDPGRIEELAARSLDRLGIAALADRNPMDVGYAARKLIATASVLAMDTPVVVLDEPTAAQDAAGLTALRHLCTDLVAENRLVIVVTHDVEFTAAVADRVVVMHDGTIILDGPAPETLARESDLATSNVRPPTAQWLATRLGMDERLPTGEQLIDHLSP